MSNKNGLSKCWDVTKNDHSYEKYLIFIIPCEISSYVNLLYTEMYDWFWIEYFHNIR